jgi:pyruvate carboxylase
MGLHRFKADEAYLVTAPNGSPVQAYLSIDEIIEIAIKNKVDAIHPGYGFLSENSKFAQKCKAAGIIFVGPKPETITKMGDKTAARKIATECGVPIIPGTDEAINSKEEAYEWCSKNGLPVMMKASMGGGGRGMRVVRKMEEVKDAFDRCSSEALTAFGDGSMFIERLIEKPRHIEVQILADATGDTVHLYDRDCSVQRRHQKVVEIAPASGLKPEVRQAMFDAAVKLCKHIGYKNAGTVEFLVENDGSAFYFIEVNPRV